MHRAGWAKYEILGSIFGAQDIYTSNNAGFYIVQELMGERRNTALLEEKNGLLEAKLQVGRGYLAGLLLRLLF